MNLNQSLNALDSLYDTPYHLRPEFLERYRDVTPDWGTVGWVTFTRTYARQLPQGGVENYFQTVKRVVEGAFSILQWHNSNAGLSLWSVAEVDALAEDMYDRIFNFKFTPSGRGFWIMGSEVLRQRGGASLNNCAFVSTGSIDESFSKPFTFLMDSSMLGVGVGIDTRGAGVVELQSPNYTDETFVVEDSREGWVALIEMVIESYRGSPRPSNVDFSLVRPKGEPLKIFGGTASGPAPLIELAEEIDNILIPEIGKPISSSAIGSVANLIGRCVVAGGIRRTAEMLLGFADDEEFVKLKDPSELNALFSEMSEATTDEERATIQHKIDRHPIVHHRWASNNTIYCGDDGSELPLIADMNLRAINIGAFWLDNARNYGRMIEEPDRADRLALGTNPCGEQVLETFELCNLVESFPARHDSPEDYERTLQLAFLYGKIVTLIPTSFEETNNVITRNRRIGVSQSGIITAMEKFGRKTYLEDYCDKQYKLLKAYDVLLSDRLAINTSVRITSVKPSGTVSLLCGATAGIHYPHAPLYIRNIRMNETSPLLKLCRDAGYLVEKDLRAPSTFVVSFPVKEEVSKGKDQASARDQFENARDLQRYWADNAVSITVTFKKSEENQLLGLLEEFAPTLKAISLLPDFDDASMPQAPYITIDNTKYNELLSLITTKLGAVDTADLEHEVTDEFCDGGLCSI